MPGSAPRSRVVTRTARPDDLPAVLALVRQHRADAHAEEVLTGQVPGAAAAAGFRRLLADPHHEVVLAVLPGPSAADGGADTAEVAVGLAVLGVDPLSVVLGVPQVTVDNLVVHREHRRRGAGAALLAAAAEHASRVGAAHVVAAVGGHEAERQRFLARMGFAPLTTRRIVAVETLGRTLASWRRSWLPVPQPRRVLPAARRRPVPPARSATASG
ncbi:GNAT family N-acetyltransferase [Blastococcus sp. TF02A-30]|uniref:GNAT family N-acetyltransferase n=1 Tax=Blastococcus sp. TF02A-30 TaxID=2250580 RepID=UPI001313EA34|nr:GNAT family N-acetyltransferase [Blastococcus sp. TF02A-30]